MVREDILAGLKQATFRGESLKQAMMSFYKAGYKKEEIEEAARFLQSEKVQEGMTTIDYSEIKQKPVQDFPKYIYPSPVEIQKPVQNIPKINSKLQVSDYSYEQKKSWLGWIILISGSLVILAAAIVAIIFKEQVTQFFTNLAG